MKLSDHPRVRGEHWDQPDAKHSFRGSPPRARGTPVCSPGRSGPAGITPACAGNTPVRTAEDSRAPDHPRVRGEHSFEGSRHKVQIGSPPRARGTRPDAQWRSERLRITPACAGNTPVHLTLHPSLRDHPRVRGEHRPGGSRLLRARGSPPRARGTHFLTWDFIAPYPSFRVTSRKIACNYCRPFENLSLLRCRSAQYKYSSVHGFIAGRVHPSLRRLGSAGLRTTGVCMVFDSERNPKTGRSARRTGNARSWRFGERR